MEIDKITRNTGKEASASLSKALNGTRPVAVAGPTAKTVLVMDDDPIMRTAAVLMLEAVGYRPKAVMDGEEALEHYRSALEGGDPYDAVILDLNVPNGLGGRETIRRLHEIDPGVRAIVASADIGNPAMEHFREFGFSGMLMKPFSLDDLSMTLRGVIRASEAGIDG